MLLHNTPCNARSEEMCVVTTQQNRLHWSHGRPSLGRECSALSGGERRDVTLPTREVRELLRVDGAGESTVLSHIRLGGCKAAHIAAQQQLCVQILRSGRRCTGYERRPSTSCEGRAELQPDKATATLGASRGGPSTAPRRLSPSGCTTNGVAEQSNE